jgi:hypothetical protein
MSTYGRYVRRIRGEYCKGAEPNPSIKRRIDNIIEADLQKGAGDSAIVKVGGDSVTITTKISMPDMSQVLDGIDRYLLGLVDCRIYSGKGKLAVFDKKDRCVIEVKKTRPSLLSSERNTRLRYAISTMDQYETVIDDIAKKIGAPSLCARNANTVWPSELLTH